MKALIWPPPTSRDSFPLSVNSALNGTSRGALMMAFGASSPERLDRAAMAQLIADGLDFVVYLDQTAEAVRAGSRSPA